MERQRSSSSNAGDGGGGIRPWAVVLLFSVFIVVFIPTIFSSSRAARPAAGFKSGWDALNLVLVLFAILCGLFGRRNSGDDNDRSPTAANQQVTQQSDWIGTNYGESQPVRRMRSSSSYPDLRLEAEPAAAPPASPWRGYDDIQLYWRRSEGRSSWESQSFREPETRTIPVDTVVLRPPRSRSPPPVAAEPPPQRLSRRRSMPVISDVAGEHSHFEPPPEKHRRRRSAEKIEVESVEPRRPSPPKAEQTLRHRRRRSMEDLPTMMEQPDLYVNQTQVKNGRHRRRRSVDDLPSMESEINNIPVADTPPRRQTATPPPPPPPPPPPLRSRDDKKNSKKRSGGGAKDIANAIAAFYQKKRKGSKSKRSYDDLHVINNSPTAAAAAVPRPWSPPPPPPPPPPSMFSNLFTKKSGGKSRRIHSAPPPPPPPPPKRRPKNPPPSPPSPPPPPPNRQSIAARHRERLMYPLPPMSPIRPPPPPPPISPNLQPSDLQLLFSDYEPATGQRSRRFEGNVGNVSNVGNVVGVEAQEEAAPPAAVFCPSPDVNNKADMFIARFREVLKLEKINSIREKGREGQDRVEEEFMMVGSLFDDDDDYLIGS